MRAKEPGSALAVICTLVGIAAVLGGHALVAWPDGSAIGLPLAVLEHSPFSDFTIPGLVLVFVIGLSNLLAAVLVRDHVERDHRHPALEDLELDGHMAFCALKDETCSAEMPSSSCSTRSVCSPSAGGRPISGLSQPRNL